MSDLDAIDRAAAKLTNAEGGFPAQEQQPPGLTSKMEPLPDPVSYTHLTLPTNREV
mgnify:CR=1 FL=1